MKLHPRLGFTLALIQLLAGIPRGLRLAWLYLFNRSGYHEAIFQRDLKRRKKEQKSE